jgi:hypothetical protein
MAQFIFLQQSLFELAMFKFSKYASISRGAFQIDAGFRVAISGKASPGWMTILKVGNP